jgi:hypothetical protein
MPNILKIFLRNTLDGIILSISESIKEQTKIQEEEKKHKKLKEGSIDVEFKVKESN